ncbi:MAG: Uma2 family endonuclease [Candidatus Viridilinea halotolerans]|uniref:Uma2 family endonuclease n=1 Tax=Candidatus Viridilinea halotolerans TaxID=2491704 RepID=A0A426TXI6_9CHLR|nr:MAG: Uma2 family endonuclease [Candidatus Viridilinea halotolerans]
MVMRLQLAGDTTDIDLASLQGLWSVEQYLKLSNQTSRLLEFTDGVIEVLPMPTKRHQAISLFMLLALLAYIRPRGGAVFYAPLRLAIRPGVFREPDLMLLLDQHDPRAQDAFWLGADLVVEIVSPDNPKRDTEEKPRDYAAAGIPEYWIVNPLDASITVLVLNGAQYTLHGKFERGTIATSHLLAGFGVAVAEVFAAG